MTYVCLYLIMAGFVAGTIFDDQPQLLWWQRLIISISVGLMWIGLLAIGAYKAARQRWWS